MCVANNNPRESLHHSGEFHPSAQKHANSRAKDSALFDMYRYVCFLWLAYGMVFTQYDSSYHGITVHGDYMYHIELPLPLLAWLLCLVDMFVLVLLCVLLVIVHVHTYKYFFYHL